MARPLRVAFGRIQQETNALSPVRTEIADFEQMYLEGDALLAAVRPGGDEVPGFFKKAELAGFLQACRADGDVTPVPIFSAWASSNGPLSTACLDELQGRFCERVAAARAAGGLDGVYISPHGAMGAVGVRDPEARVLAAIREAAGGAPVVTSHDLHANLTRARVEATTAIVGYRTNPHRDFARTGRRAGELLLGALRGTMRPTVAWRTLPMILGGGVTIDFLAPMRPVFQRMKAMERDPRVLSCTTFMVHPFNDDPALGWSTYVVTDGDQALAERLADELAEMVWARRDVPPPTFKSASEAIAIARGARLRRKLGVVTLSDTSDVVTAGAPGDSTHLMRALLEQGEGLVTYVGVRDPAAVEACWELAPGSPVELALGGGLDPARSPPLPVRGTLRSKHRQQGFLRALVLEVAHLRIVVTEGPSMVMRPSFYTAVGLRIWDADVVVVKNFFPFLMFFAPYSRKTVFVRTHGTTDLDAAFALTFDGPMHPRDAVADWRPRDRSRRLGAPA
ncbi:MAG: M81 family metallopeptidase [Kofleriaceae bacterium]